MTDTTKRPAITARLLRPGGQRRLRRGRRGELAKGFAALADPVRLRLLSLIAAGGAQGACVCDLVGPSGRSQPTVSHHLKILREAGLVTSEKRGTWAWYHVQPERLDTLKSALG